MDKESYLAALCRAVPYHIVERVLDDASESAFAYRDQPGSVLVADLVSFTAMCERMAEGGQAGLGQLSRILDDLFSRFELDALFPYKGYVTEFGGDAITAVFFGPDHALRCAAAALKCQEVVARAASGALGEESRDLRLRVGVATGSIRLSVLGDLSRRVPICAGAAPHAAIILQQRAGPGEVLIDEATASQLGLRADWERDPSRGLLLRQLRSWPEAEPLNPLAPRLNTRVEEKIALLEPFVPAPVARRLRTLPSGWRIDGEIRRPIILFADIGGFTENGQYLKVATSLSRSLLRAFQKYDGLVLKVTATESGHRVMVLFGLHAPTEYDAEKAILGALEAITRLRGYLDTPTMSLTMRVGIHTGPVYFGAVGGEHKHDLTAVGDAVNVTARVATAAGPFEVLVTEEAMERARGAFTWSARGPIRVKGRQEPLCLFAIHGPSAGRAHYARRRTTQRFTAGRDAEMEALYRAADEAMAGRGRLVGIRGDPGTGKSHLLSNLVDRWVNAGGTAMVGRCRYATRATPLGPVRELFAAITGITDGDDEQARFDRVAKYVGGKALGMEVPELVSILQPARRPDGFDETLVDLADLHARDRLVAALIRLIDHRVSVERARLLYVVEDLHFADSLTLELAARLGSLSRDRGFMIVGTWRPDPVLRSLEAATDVLVPTENLDLASSTELIRHEMRAGGVEPVLAEFLWKRTQGNCEHLVQTVRFLADRLLLTLRGDTVVASPAWRDRLDELVPPSWEHVALARLDGLNEIERRVLRTASAIGGSFGQDLLEETASDSLDREMISDAIGALEAHRIFSPDSGAPRTWRFRDDATRAMAYAVIPEEERQAVHRRIADVLERTPETHLEQVAPAVAHHRERAGQVREALRWYGLVAHFAFRSGLESEARLFARKWNELHTRLPAGERIPDSHAAWMAVIRLYLTASEGRVKEALEDARVALPRYRRHMDASAIDLARYTLARSRDVLGMLPKARSGLMRTRRSATRSIAFESALGLGQIAEWTRNLEEGVRWMHEAEALSDDMPYRQIRIELLRGWLELARGRLERASATFEEVRHAAGRHEQTRLRGAAASGLGAVAWLQGLHGEARREFDEALRFARGQGNLREEASALVRKGGLLLWQSEFDEALTTLERGAMLIQEGGHHRLQVELKVHLGAAIAMTRDLAEGTEMLREGIRESVEARLWLPELFGRAQLSRVARIANADVGAVGDEELFRTFPLTRELIIGDA